MKTVKKVSASIATLRTKIFGGSGLKSDVFRGGSWLGLGSSFELAFRFGRNMVLTRLLAPEAFGIMAIVYSASYVIDMLAEIGVKEAIIQNPNGHESRYVNAAWWLSFVRGLISYILLFAAAPLLGRYYGYSELSSLMRIALLGIVLLGAQSPRSYVALKEMKFRKWTIMQSGSGLLGSLLVIVLTFFLRNVWALAIGYAAENLIRCVASYVLFPYCPKFELDRDASRGLLTFSRGVFGLSFLNLIFSRADIFILGKMYAASDLGVYTMAVYLAQVPTAFISNVLSQTLMPSFARMQGDSSRMNGILTRATAVLAILGMPVLVFIALSNHSILSLIYGPRYILGSSTLMFAALVAFVNLLNVPITVIFYAVGRPQDHRRCVLIMAVLMIAITYPAAKEFGLVGGQIAALVAVVVGFVSQLVRIRQLTKLKFLQYSRILPSTVVVSSVVLCLFWGIRHFLPLREPVANLSFALLACSLTIVIFSKQLVRQLATKLP